MGVDHRLLTTAHGRPVLVKTARGSADIARLVHEAAMLRAAAHPGVVAVVAETDADGGHELQLAVAGSRTVADLRTDLVGVAGLVSALSATLADLHALGIVHGRVTAEHVVVDGSGRPVLCGFSGAARTGSAALDGGPALAPADDVAGVGRLLARLVDAPAEPPVRARRLAWHRDRTAGVRRALLALAAQATADDPALRPSAGALSASIVATLPGARLPRLDRPTADAAGEPVADPAAPRRVPRRAGAPVAAALGLGLLAFGVGGLLRPPSGRAAPQVALRAPAGGDSTTTAPAPATSAATSSTSTPRTATTTALTTPVIEISPGVVALDGVRYAVGRPDDLLVVGDWDCDGAPTVAVVRPRSGEVFLFDGWAAAGHDAVAHHATTVPGAASARAADDDGDGCPTLVVTALDGGRTEVPV